MAHQNLEWHFVDAEAEVTGAEEMSTDSPVEPDIKQTAEDAKDEPKKMGYLYELICGIAFLYGVTLYLVWQQATQQIALIEQNVAALHDGISALQQRGTEDALFTTQEAKSPRDFYVETAYLRYEASAETLEILKRIAPRVDAKFEQLHRAFGLSLPPPAEKLRIIVAPTERVNRPVMNLGQLYRVASEEQLVMAYPKYAAEQHEISEEDALVTELFAELAVHLLKEAIASREIKPQWQGMTLALKTHVQLEHGYNPHWQWEDMFLLHRYNAQGTSLAFVHEVTHEPEGTSEQWSQPRPTAYATANTLVEFILVTYGDDKVSALLDAFAEHDTWKTLAPALFHLSADEFEAQWHAYLREHYPIPP